MSQKLFGVLALIAMASALSVGLEETPARSEELSLYDRLGGIYPIALVVDDLINRVAENDVLNDNPAIYAARKPERFPGLKYQLTTMVCQATGGPCSYTGKSMEEAHEGMGITEAEWQELVDDFKASLAHFGVPEAEQQELLAIVDSTKGAIVAGGAAE